METALVLGSEQKPTGLRFRQRMLSDTNNLTITVDGIFDTSAGSVQVTQPSLSLATSATPLASKTARSARPILLRWREVFAVVSFYATAR